MQESLLSNPVLYGVAITLFHFLWQGCLVALALKALLMLTSTKNAQLRYGYTFVAMLANLVLPIVTFYVLYRPNYSHLSNQASGMLNVSSETNISSLSAELWSHDLFAYFPSIAVIWLIGITALSTKLLIELYGVNRLAQQGAVTPDEDLVNRFKTLADKLSLKNTPQLVISLKTDVPMAIGWLKPVVLVPFSMLSGLTPMQLDMLLLHELAHIRRHDYLVNFLQTLIEIMLFFHPCVKWVSKQMRNEREYCSDDIAVHHCGDAMAYAHTLADTASLCRKHASHSIPTMAMAASGGDLKQRVVRLVDQHHCASTNEISKWFASIAVIGFVISLAVQNQIRLPHIDLNSGKISLGIDKNDVKKDTTAVEPVVINENSLASKLLEHDNDKKQLATKVEPTQREVSVATAPIKKAAVKHLEKKSLTVSEKSTLEAKQTIVAKQEKKIELPNIADVGNENKKQSLSTQVIVAKPNIVGESRKPKSNIFDSPSMMEQAFDRTDSNTKQSSMANPYANQIASLTENVTESEIAQQLKESINETKTIQIETAKPVENSTNTYFITQTLPKVLYSVEPRYPTTAKRKGIELEILVNFTIDSQGNVKNIIFPSKGKVGYFRSAIRSALEKWRFDPARKNGEATDSKMSKIFSFSLVK